ncbi:uncharacterized protein BCR38DRAFT_435844 [Pseudomassariella vexata]|uniref:Uncharacterized protein n=1 Tax=Pseudomassariella vexata TaxID=1141098 RepID=A0A1Y2DWT3_9PEZI|nr:uncharacterized protein BCR38DRAFT_435844 [Pseudomassariella vexata]ORY63085.1 hypothetical protein BCR38DRAFT_435844 [Pseudomassariella vexata]
MFRISLSIHSLYYTIKPFLLSFRKPTISISPEYRYPRSSNSRQHICMPSLPRTPDASHPGMTLTLSSNNTPCPRNNGVSRNPQTVKLDVLLGRSISSHNQATALAAGSYITT